MPRSYKTGFRIPADKVDFFNLKFKTALLKHNVLAYAECADSGDYCALQLTHQSLNSSDPRSRALDLKNAMKLLRENLPKFNSSTDTTTVNDDSSIEILHIFDKKTPLVDKKQGKGTKVRASSRLRPLRIPEILVLDRASTPFRDILETDISFVNLLEDSVSKISNESNNSDVQMKSFHDLSQINQGNNNDSDVQVLSEKLTNSAKKRKLDDSSDVTVLEIIPLDSPKKRCQYRQKGRNLLNLSNISTPVKSKADKDIVVLSSDVKPLKKSRKISRKHSSLDNSLKELTNDASISGFSSGKKRGLVKIIKAKSCTPKTNKENKKVCKRRNIQNSGNSTNSSESSQIIKRTSKKQRAVDTSYNLRKKGADTGPSKIAMKYYELLNVASNKLKESPRLKGRSIKPLSPKKSNSPKNFIVSSRENLGLVLSKKKMSAKKKPLLKVGSPKKWKSAKKACSEKNRQNARVPSARNGRHPSNGKHSSLGKRPVPSPGSRPAHSNMYNPDPVDIDAEGPRPIIVDGCNICFSHGQSIFKTKTFSAHGARLVVEYFHKRGHQQIKVFFPLHYEVQIPPKLKEELESKCQFVWTPSRVIDGVRKTSYDDRFIIQYAGEVGGIIVSRDKYRDLKDENPGWENLINKKLLEPTFVGNVLIFPLDPLGQGGPTLDEFLSY